MTAACEHCGEPFARKAPQQRFCSLRCTKRAAYARERDRREAERRAGLPPFGELVREADDEGRALCHVCGGAYHHLANHALMRHGLAADDYRGRFGLNRQTPLASLAFQRKQAAGGKRLGGWVRAHPERNRLLNASRAQRILWRSRTLELRAEGRASFRRAGPKIVAKRDRARWRANLLRAIGKLSPEAVAAIRAGGERTGALAKRYGVNRTAIQKARRGDTHAPP